MEAAYFISGYGDVVGKNMGVVHVSDGKVKDVSWIECGLRPSFFVHDQDFLYIVDELNIPMHGTHGRLNVFKKEQESFVLVQQESVGEDPCFILLDASHRLVILTDYSSGEVDIFNILEDGRLERNKKFSYEGSSVVKDRQDSSHPHSAMVVGDTLYIADLGLDLIHVYSIGKDSSISDLRKIQMPPGSGPRMMTYDDQAHRITVLSELDSMIRWIDDDGQVMPYFCKTTTSGSFNTASSLVSYDGYWYVSNRGADTVSKIEFGKGIVKEVPVGKCPRFMGLLDKKLYVLGQDSDSITILDPDQLGELGEFSFPAPTCISF